MENQVAMEAAEILKKLSPQNQAYFMTMLRVADATERNVKASMRGSTLAARPERPDSENPKQCALF